MTDQAFPKPGILRDRSYLNWLRTQRCIFTGLLPSEYEAIDPAHLGTAGKGLKSPDDEVFPVRHSIHLEMHQRGEITTIRKYAPDWLILAAMRAYGRELYKMWKGGDL